MSKKTIVLAGLMVLFSAFVMSACLPQRAVDTAVEAAKKIAAERDEILRLYNEAQREAANFPLTVDTEYAKVQAITIQSQQYYEAVTQSGEVWTGNFRDEEKAVTDKLNSFRDKYGGVPQGQLNLQQMEEQGLLPNNMADGFSLYVNSVVQAPPPVPDATVTTNLMTITSESMETIRASGVYWNTAASNYNAYRQKVSSEAIAAASELLGYPLPGLLPLYQGGNTGPVTNPIAPTP